MAYAKDTQVSQTASLLEIEKVLARYGADQFMYGKTVQCAVIGFVMSGRQVRITVPLPDKADRQFWVTDTGRDRSESVALKEWEQACKQKYRALSLVVKAKLEAVEAGITTFEEEFMAHLVLPGAEKSQLLYVLDATPNYCMADHDAEVAAKAIDGFIDYLDPFDFDRVDLREKAEQYADQLRAKAGE